MNSQNTNRRANRRGITRPVIWGSAHVCFKTENIQELYKKLSANGVRLHCTTQNLGGIWVIYFRGPDGIILEAMQGDPLA